jgi:hypothetical protein
LGWCTWMALGVGHWSSLDTYHLPDLFHAYRLTMKSCIFYVVFDL